MEGAADRSILQPATSTDQRTVLLNTIAGILVFTNLSNSFVCLFALYPFTCSLTPHLGLTLELLHFNHTENECWLLVLLTNYLFTAHRTRTVFIKANPVKSNTDYHVQ